MSAYFFSLGVLYAEWVHDNFESLNSWGIYDHAKVLQRIEKEDNQ